LAAEATNSGGIKSIMLAGVRAISNFIAMCGDGFVEVQQTCWHGVEYAGEPGAKKRAASLLNG